MPFLPMLSLINRSDGMNGAAVMVASIDLFTSAGDCVRATGSLTDIFIGISIFCSIGSLGMLVVPITFASTVLSTPNALRLYGVAIESYSSIVVRTASVNAEIQCSAR